MAADTDHAEYLNSLANNHQARLASALVALERRITDYVASAPLQDGQLFDLEWAVNARPELRNILREEYLVEVDNIVRDYREVHQQAIGMIGRYAKQQVHDSLMQFDASVNIAVGKASGAKKWKYYGRIVEESRSHCREHKGKVYTEDEINEIWQGDWAGKIDGNPFVVRGGYNCGHHWRPVFD